MSETPKTVWKFPVSLQDGAQEIRLPNPGKPLLFAEQAGHLCVWWEVEPGAEEQSRHVQIVGTGYDIPSGYQHVGSVLQGAYVWHLYAELGSRLTRSLWLSSRRARPAR